MSERSSRPINSNDTWRQLTDAGNIYDAGNASEFKTGDWRSMRPVWLEEKCKQCLLCFPVCPDSSIPVNSEGKRTEFDFDHCKGCGVCFKVCPFKAIDFVEEGK
jgi:pyruvate ferredoxin oxidoreductase delta subunit